MNGIVHLIYNDRIESGILKNQVFLEAKIKSAFKKVSIILIWQPHIFFKEFKKLRSFEKDLSSHDIDLICLPIALPSRYLEKTKIFLIYLKFIGRFLSFYLKKKIRKNYKIEIISRAYHAGIIASVIKSKIKKINHNFDPRSLYPEESVTVQKWSFGGKIYQKWKKEEKFILNFTDKVSVVTPEMYQWFKSEGFKGEIALKHFNINEKIFNLEISEPGLSNFYREKYKIRPDTIIFGFLGSLGSSRQWNSIYPYIKHLNSLYLLVGKNIEFCFAIKSSWLNKMQKTELRNSLKCRVIFLEDLSIEESLSFFNLGCHIMLDGPDNITRVGIKVYEYLAAGLPVLTNSSAGAACNLSKKMNGFIDIMSIYKLENHIVDDLKRMTRTKHRILIRKNFLKYLKEFNI